MGIVAQSQRPPTPAPVSAGQDLPLRRRVFQALGTPCELQYAAPGGDQQAAAFESSAIAWVEAFEARYSRFRPTSLVSRINAAAGVSWVETDAEMEQMLKLCETLVFMTQGILDPTALPLIRLWNWKDPNPSVPAPEAVAAARRLVGWSKVQRAPGRVFLPETGMALDFGGFGKEYAVDMVSQIAAQSGIRSVLVDFGHDIRVLGTPPGRPAWHIGLENPSQPGKHSSSVALAGSVGIASSGDYIRRFVVDGRRYGHIIDPRSGYPVYNGMLSASVIAPNCTLAGILSTSAFVLGPKEGLEMMALCPGVEGAVITDNNQITSRNFNQYATS